MFTFTDNGGASEGCADNVKPSESDCTVDRTAPTGTAKEGDTNVSDTGGVLHTDMATVLENSNPSLGPPSGNGGSSSPTSEYHYKHVRFNLIIMAGRDIW